MDMGEKWLDWAIELQALAQAGLYYSRDRFDIERFTRIREISAEMLSLKSAIPVGTVKDLFCGETGYQTPKIDTRAAIFSDDGRILLVRETDGRWALPGGWCDVNMSVGENTLKEVKEEAGLDAELVRVIAVQDRERHNHPRYAYRVCKIFSLCRATGGEFHENSETTESAYFPLDDLPPLAEEKNTPEQLALCFAAYKDDNWQTVVE